MKQYIADAFTDTLFKGNQAAVCVMDEWIPDGLMQNIAKENRFSETAFTVKEGNTYHLRWFTPGGEIDFCGHATLGTSFVLFTFYEKNAEEIKFTTQVGTLAVRREGGTFVMDFPAYHCRPIPVTQAMKDAIGAEVLEAYLDRDLLLVLKDEETVIDLRPDQRKMGELDGLLVAVTAKGSEYDCVSRVFAPKLAVEEDPVTGSAHCMITPYWCEKLGKDHLTCYQASERSGLLYTGISGDRVTVAGKAVLYSEGNIL
ncbi:PhzF family phenazine biosynthesis protein [Mobilibacterium timonense]|nr:PhzF family phenazine biosynthesis protein [Mobilibacterium timonense]